MSEQKPSTALSVAVVVVAALGVASLVFDPESVRRRKSRASYVAAAKKQKK